MVEMVNCDSTVVKSMEVYCMKEQGGSDKIIPQSLPWHNQVF